MCSHHQKEETKKDFLVRFIEAQVLLFIAVVLYMIYQGVNS